MMVYNFANCFRFIDMYFINNFKNYLFNTKNNYYNHYSGWLNIYEEYVIKDKTKIDTFNYNTLSFFDILAGVFGMKIKINNRYLNQIIANVNFNYNNDNRIIIYNSLDNQIKERSTEEISKILSEMAPKQKKELEDYTRESDKLKKKIYITEINELLSVGYDENLLLELFAPLTRVNFTFNHRHAELNSEQINIHKQLFSLVSNRQNESDPHIEYDYNYISNLI